VTETYFYGRIKISRYIVNKYKKTEPYGALKNLNVNL